jgi:hypothetical protein
MTTLMIKKRRLKYLWAGNSIVSGKTDVKKKNAKGTNNAAQ